MTPADILSRLRDFGLTALADGENLIVRPRSAITDEARELIRAHKAELLAALSTETGTSWGWRIAYPNREPFEIFELPEPTRDMVEQSFPGATVNMEES